MTALQGEIFHEDFSVAKSELGGEAKPIGMNSLTINLIHCKTLAHSIFGIIVFSSLAAS